MPQSIDLGGSTFLDASAIDLPSQHISLADGLTWTPVWAANGSPKTAGDQVTLTRGAKLYACFFGDSSNTSSTRGLVFCRPGMGTMYLPICYSNNVTWVRLTAAMGYIKIESVGNASLYMHSVHGLL